MGINVIGAASAGAISRATTIYFLQNSGLDFFDTSSLGAGLYILIVEPDSSSYTSPSITFYNNSNTVLTTINSNSATYYSAVPVSKIRFTQTGSLTGRATLIFGAVDVVNIRRINASGSVVLNSTSEVVVFGGGAGGQNAGNQTPAGGGGSGYLNTGTISAGTYTATIGGGGGAGGSGTASSFSTITANGGLPGSGGDGGNGGSGGGAGGTSSNNFGSGGANGANGENATGRTGGTGSNTSLPALTTEYPGTIVFPTSAGGGQRGAGAFYGGGGGCGGSGFTLQASSGVANTGAGGGANTNNAGAGSGGSGTIFIIGG